MSENQRIKPSEAFIAQSQEVLHELLHDQSGIDGVLIASTDGFHVKHEFRKNYDEDKLSAVGSSILSLVQAIGIEANLENCESLILTAQNGKIAIDAVPTSYYPMLLIVLANDNVVLGKLMHGMGKAKKALGALDTQCNTHIAAN